MKKLNSYFCIWTFSLALTTGLLLPPVYAAEGDDPSVQPAMSTLAESGMKQQKAAMKQQKQAQKAAIKQKKAEHKTAMKQLKGQHKDAQRQLKEQHKAEINQLKMQHKQPLLQDQSADSTP